MAWIDGAVRPDPVTSGEAKRHRRGERGSLRVSRRMIAAAGGSGQRRPGAMVRSAPPAMRR